MALACFFVFLFVCLFVFSFKVKKVKKEGNRSHLNFSKVERNSKSKKYSPVILHNWPHLSVRGIKFVVTRCQTVSKSAVV